jgi:hypothetical protein
MSNNAKPISNLAITTTLSSSDRVVVLANAATTANVKTIALSDFANNFAITNLTPASSSANGFVGQITFDTNNLYICVSNNVWKKIALSTF